MAGARTRTTLFAQMLLLAGATVLGFSLHACGGSSRLVPGSADYEELVRSFDLGLAQLDVGLLDAAEKEFTRATELAPREPAAWANLALARLRLGRFDEAAEPLARAASLAPDSSHIAYLQGRMAAISGRLDDGIAELRRATELDPANLQARYALIEELGRSGEQRSDDQVQRLLDELMERAPDNLVVLLESVRVAAQRNDVAALQSSVKRLGEHRRGWPSHAAERFDDLERAVAAGNLPGAARAATFLRNSLLPTAAFQESRQIVATASELVGEPFDRFLVVTPPSSTPADADEGLTFTRETLASESAPPASALLAVSLDGATAPVLLAADGSAVRRVGAPAETSLVAGSGSARASSLLALDWNHDFRMDLFTTGPVGVRLLLQGDDGTFSDATPQANSGGEPIAGGAGAAHGAWAADLEMDGDLDLVVGVRDAAPLLLRNNGDGTWRPLATFLEPVDLRAFVWADLDGDADPDATLLGGEGVPALFSNRQGGVLERMPDPAGLTGVVALTVADLDGDGGFDLITVDGAGSVKRSSWSDEGWQTTELASWPEASSVEVGSARLFAADLDNNGALDLVASAHGGTTVWLAAKTGGLQPLTTFADAEVFSVIDLDGDGHLDLAALSAGQPVRLLGRGTRPYHWQVVRPRAQQVAGDQRINSFGVGGEIEIRAGLLTQKQLLTGDPAHFGLGTRDGIDVIRIQWPNGVVQAEFERGADEVVEAEQRLKGSCPWVFAYDGSGMRFVTDFLWRSPLGLRINALDTAGVSQTEDWIRIGGDQLAPHDGVYDVRITAELWETHFIDQITLTSVDHPDDVEVFVDERFSPQGPQARALALHAVRHLRPAAAARDESGRRVGDLVAELDGRTLATFELGRYQGIAQEHFVELDAPAGGLGDARWLVAQGWVYPTDSSINLAIGQGSHPAPHGIALEAQDESGRFVVVAPDLGFPAGKSKTMLIDLGALDRAGLRDTRRLRLRTNLEVYWDRLTFADAADTAGDEPPRITRLAVSGAELAYHGFSRTTYSRRAPETPHYDEIANVTQRWRDLTGRYTRFGDVEELVSQVDDRYVIMNAGDELRLRFPAQPPPESGWRRDFVLAGDGWNKDGDYNTSYSQTVLPLPSHRQSDYRAAGAELELEADPVYQHHRDDWDRYHTRFVTPRTFLRGLRRSGRAAKGDAAP